MLKFFLCIVGGLFPVLAFAQDMPLHEIIKAGESWKLSTVPFPEVKESGFIVKPTEKVLLAKIGSEELSLKLPLVQPSCVTTWHSGMILIGDAGGKHVWAFNLNEKTKSLSGGEHYAPLRLPVGELRSEVSALTVDGSNRFYAAYKAGIMAFDPTGRPCGIITSPSTKPVDALAFKGNELYAKVGDQVFIRKMLASRPSK